MIVPRTLEDIFCSLHFPIDLSSRTRYGSDSIFGDSITLTGLMSRGSMFCKITLTVRVEGRNISAGENVWRDELYDISTMEALDRWVYRSLWVGEWGLRKKVVDAICEEEGV